MNVKLVLLLILLFVYVCLNVSPSPPYMRSEKLATRLEIEITSILTLTVLCACLSVHILPHIDLNCKFVSYNTRLNTLSISAKRRKQNNLNFFLLLISYFLIFESYFVIFLPFECKGDLNIQRITKRIAFLVKLFHASITCTTLCACIRVTVVI